MAKSIKNSKRHYWSCMTTNNNPNWHKAYMVHNDTQLMANSKQPKFETFNRKWRKCKHGIPTIKKRNIMVTLQHNNTYNTYTYGNIRTYLHFLFTNPQPTGDYTGDPALDIAPGGGSSSPRSRRRPRPTPE